ncbi:glycine-rich cell wall structural protein 1.8-like [Salvia miltiorrhiza]|uniref:glycine-rich cell wall structural protein 1.8-like n=1 Tax=Salvia miltiorrhiza TaxID=226208 RepID=UPI0025ABC07F|nr:glycine-rich cell wall structural protein 1.8-like [Salvia miltiorrhiza]
MAALPLMVVEEGSGGGGRSERWLGEGNGESGRSERWLGEDEGGGSGVVVGEGTADLVIVVGKGDEERGVVVGEGSGGGGRSKSWLGEGRWRKRCGGGEGRRGGGRAD